MGQWKRMQSANENRSKEQIRGFLPFTEGAEVQGPIVAARMRDDGSGKGYYLIRTLEPCTVNVRDVDSKTGQAFAKPGELVGVRKTGATKVLSRLPLDTVVKVTYVRWAEKESINPKTKQKEANMYHYVDVDVYAEEGKAA